MTHKKTTVRFKSLQQLFRTKSRWTKGAYAINKAGDEVKVTDPAAVKFCLLGGMRAVYGDSTPEYYQAKEALTSVLANKYGEVHIAGFNDKARRQFRTIQKVVREAGI